MKEIEKRKKDDKREREMRLDPYSISDVDASSSVDRISLILLSLVNSSMISNDSDDDEENENEDDASYRGRLVWSIMLNDDWSNEVQ